MASTPSAESAGQVASYREFSVAAAVVGVLIGVLMTCAFVYTALRLGVTLQGSTVAAILGFASLRGALRRGSLLETNISQTIASGVNNASSGIAFTLPALFILAASDASISFSPWPILLSAMGGSFLGIVVIIPLRKQMIEFERLRFPTGIAVASLLRSPGAGLRQAKLLAGGFAVALTCHLLVGLGVLADAVDVGSVLGLPAYLPIVIAVSFAAVGAGLLSGRGGLPFVLGGVLAWWGLAPAAVGLGWVPGVERMNISAAAASGWEDFAAWDVAYAAMLRPLGIGILIGGALAGVVASLPALRAAIAGLSAVRGDAHGGGEEMSARVLSGGVVASILVLFAAAYLSTDTIGLLQAVGIALLGTVWLAVAGLVVAQASGMTDITPISGMSLIGVSLMFLVSGGNVVVAVVLGVAVSIGVGQCADMMSDLKAGHLMGALPKQQQLAQAAVAWVGVPVAIGMVYFLWQHGGFGPSNPGLPAPQGSALAAAIDGLRAGDAPIDKYMGGAGIGLALGALPVPGLGVLVGLAMVLPISIVLAYGLGCVAHIALRRFRGRAFIDDAVVPVAAGFIVGDALTSLGLVVAYL